MIDETFLQAKLQANLQANAGVFDDFWNRRIGDARFEKRYPCFGYEIHLQTNDPAVIRAGELSAARYCLAQPFPDTRTIELHVLAVPSLPNTPVPADLPARLQTIGVGDYMFQAATPWVQWFTDLNARRSYSFVSPALAAEPRVVSRNLLDRASNNILLREGVGQLHATTLMRDDCVVLFVAPHGTGKSTTAFHLLNAGYRLMGDGLLFVREHEPGQFELMGYPVGEAKLTSEAKPLFPEWRGEGDEVSVHNVLKHIVNLRTLAPHKMIDHSIFPRRLLLCLAERNGQPYTTAERLDAATTFQRVLPDTLQWDEPQAMLRSLGVLERLIEHASCYRLTLGADRAQLVETISGLD